MNTAVSALVLPHGCDSTFACGALMRSSNSLVCLLMVCFAVPKAL